MTGHTPRIPDAEQLGRRERFILLLRELGHALVRDTEAFTGVPNAQQQVQRGITELEKYVNRPPRQ